MTANIEQLSEKHDTTRLNCGVPGLDEWLKNAARTAVKRDTARVYVIADDNNVVVAYSALLASTIGPDVLTSRAGRGISGAIPAVLLGKLAVDLGHRKGLGAALLVHAGRIALSVSEHIGARILYADAKNDAARTWYLNKGMSSIQGGMVCYARIKDLAAPSTSTSA